MLKYIGNFEKLVNYGFENHIMHPINSYLYQDIDEDGYSRDEGYIAIGEERNIVLIHEDGETRYCLDKLYDLIKDGLVVKVIK